MSKRSEVWSLTGEMFGCVCADEREQKDVNKGHRCNTLGNPTGGKLESEMR